CAAASGTAQAQRHDSIPTGRMQEVPRIRRRAPAPRPPRACLVASPGTRHNRKQVQRDGRRMAMRNTPLREAVDRLLPRVQGPAQSIGGELNSVVKDHRAVRGKLCLAFPDTYALGTSHHGLQVLYTIMNDDPQWACERAFAPWLDFEAELRRGG